MTRHLATAIVALFFWLSGVQAAQFTFEKDDKGVTVKVDGQLFTRYIIKSGNKPILWPVIGPTGKAMTRGYPMRDVIETEKKDHVHHRSFWFDHGDVNGISFWHEADDTGTIEHREFLELTDGQRPVIRTRNDWVGPDGKIVCEDVRTITFGADDATRWIDFAVTVTASNGKVVFGDTKEGSFGVRVAGSMRVKLKQGGKIVNSEGDTDARAWGKRAAWVDYSGPVDNEIVGIAILNHPKSFRYPTYWHVRTYGLFAANPFGLHHFLKSSDKVGALTLNQGDSFSMLYRVILHRGDEKAGKIAEAFRRYAKQPVGDDAK